MSKRTEDVSFAALPTDEDIHGYFEQLSNRHRWPDDDELGALNFITAAKVISAARLVRTGRHVSCARRLDRSNTLSGGGDFLHFMIETGEGWNLPSKASISRREMAKDFVGLEIHGANTTHIDALGHFVRGGRMYGGAPAEAISVNCGAIQGSIEAVRSGIVSRGVLLDIADLRGVPTIEPGDAILPHELQEAERRARVRVESGDVVLIRTGTPIHMDNCRQLQAASGLHAACLPWVHERQVSIIFSDSWTDVVPSGLSIDLPVHRIAELAMGVRCTDSGDFEALASVCRAENRWEFMICMAPLRLQGATGSPINPLAIF